MAHEMLISGVETIRVLPFVAYGILNPHLEIVVIREQPHEVKASCISIAIG
jgi:hypothetical protein